MFDKCDTKSLRVTLSTIILLHKDYGMICDLITCLMRKKWLIAVSICINIYFLIFLNVHEEFNITVGEDDLFYEIRVQKLEVPDILMRVTQNRPITFQNISDRHRTVISSIVVSSFTVKIQ